MSVIVLPALVLAPLLLVGAIVAVAVALGRRPDPAPSEAAEAARSHGTRVAVTAWLLPVLICLVAGGPLGVVALRTSGDVAPVVIGLAPALLGLGYLGVHAIGERTWPRPAGPVRRAALVRRLVSDVAPAWLRRTVHGLTATAVITLVACGANGARDGRSIETEGYVDGIFTARSASPYPGWDFALPLLVAVVVVALAAEGVLRLVASRPAIVDADPAYDAASRRLSSHRALRGAVLVIGCTLAGVLVVAGNALQAVEVRELGASATILGVLVGLGSLVAAAVPAPPVTAPRVGAYVPVAPTALPTTAPELGG